MLTSWTVVLIAVAYVGVLFAVASYGDRKIASATGGHGKPRPLIYALSLAVYCTSWTFFGSVGLSARTGYDFLPIYIGPIVMFAVGWPVLRLIVAISKRHNITSIADFISARYGKNQWLGAAVALIAVIGIVPYISLQLKAISVSLHTILPQPLASAATSGTGDNFALLVTVALAGFAMLFGTRHIDTTEHQDGLILAIAVESVIKLAAFLLVGIFCTFWLLGGLNGLFDTLAQHADIADVFNGPIDWGRWATMTVLSSFAIFLLPRQFHVAVVENTALSDVKRAAWLFPLYLVVINLFVAPIAIAGLKAFPTGFADADFFVLSLPVSAGQKFFVLAAFIGGLSAATAMVIVEAIALSIMVCNNLVIPYLLRRPQPYGEMGPVLLMIRRSAIVVILALAYGYYQMISASAALAQIGLLSFAAAAQFAPAFFGGLVWKRGTAHGAMGGILTGFAVWIYTLALPLFSDAGWLPGEFVSKGLLGIEMLRPRALFGLNLDPLTHGVMLSLAANVTVYVLASLSRGLKPLEKVQADEFVRSELQGTHPAFRLTRGGVTVGELQQTVGRYLGKDRTRRSYEEFAETRNITLRNDDLADAGVLRFSEHLLAKAVGSSSSRLVLALLMESQNQGSSETARLLDDASDALQHNRDLLQSAIDHVRQGIAVFDNDMNLICWNSQFRLLLGLPRELGRVGVPLYRILAHLLHSNGFSGPALERQIEKRLKQLSSGGRGYQEEIDSRSIVLDAASSKLPDGGIVVTFADVTETVDARRALEQANETLERRVEERTAELTGLNTQLEQARAEAEKANIGKTRFVAAASHDILQPLNAARLFTSSLVERTMGDENEKLVCNVDASLEAVEEILSALLDISKLDSGVMKADISRFRLAEILQPLQTQFTPLAQEMNVRLKIMPTSAQVISDKKLLRRLVQNLVTNAVKYSPGGKVLVGCRRNGDYVRIEVVDTGEGIASEQQEKIFQEFTRINKNTGNVHGLGLGLSIVRRIGKVLGHELSLRSSLGKGSRFSVRIPAGDGHVKAFSKPGKAPRASAVLGNLTVLVVDNDAAIVEGMVALLKGWGCETLPAHGKKEALALVKENAPLPDVILADYHLDEGNGLEVIAAIRKKTNVFLPAVLITADRSNDVAEAARANEIGYMRKPVKPAGLRAAIAHVMARVQAAE